MRVLHHHLSFTFATLLKGTQFVVFLKALCNLVCSLTLLHQHLLFFQLVIKILNLLFQRLHFLTGYNSRSVTLIYLFLKRLFFSFDIFDVLGKFWDHIFPSETFLPLLAKLVCELLNFRLQTRDAHFKFLKVPCYLLLFLLQLILEGQFLIVEQFILVLQLSNQKLIFSDSPPTFFIVPFQLLAMKLKLFNPLCVLAQLLLILNGDSFFVLIALLSCN